MSVLAAWPAPLAAGVAAGLVLWLALTRTRRVRPGGLRRGGPRTTTLLRFARHFATPAVDRLLGRIGPGEERLSELRAAAGVGVRFSHRDVRSLQCICAALAGGAAIWLSPATGATTKPVLVVAAAWAGSAVPVVWLRRIAAHRAQATRAVLADALELLRACVAGGMPLRRALTAVSDHCREPVAAEFANVAAEAALGVPLLTALDGLCARNPLPEMRGLVVAIRHAETHGAPLADALGAIAHDAGRAFERQLADRAAAAGPKIQLLVSTLLVPAALLEFAALLIAAVATGRLHLL